MTLAFTKQVMLTLTSIWRKHPGFLTLPQHSHKVKRKSTKIANFMAETRYFKGGTLRMTLITRSLYDAFNEKACAAAVNGN